MKKPTARQRKLLEEYKKTLSLSPLLFEICIGTMIGDANIQTQNSGKSFRLRFEQADNKHREYLHHLHELFYDWVLSEPHFNPERKMWTFQTISHSEFNKLAEIFVMDNQGRLCKKHVKPNFIELYMTPRAFSYWMMDDGYLENMFSRRSCYNKDYERKGFALNTQGFDKKNVEILCTGLQQKYGFDCWIKPNKKGFVIVISGKNHKQVLDMISPYIIPSMRHKIPGIEKYLTQVKDLKST